MISSVLLAAIFAAPAFGQYCNAGPSSAIDSNLGSVTLAGINHGVDCPGQLGLQLFLGELAHLTRNQQYTLTYAVTTWLARSFAVVCIVIHGQLLILAIVWSQRDTTVQQSQCSLD